MKKLFLLLSIAFFVFSCEKDDICDQETTPRLIVGFFDIDNPTVPVNVAHLEVTGDDMADSLNTFNAVSKIELPLNTNADTTGYTFTINSTSSVGQNTDHLKFNYTRENIFVSRACGYKTVFHLDPVTSFIQDNGTDGQWMQNVTVSQPNIVNENEVHLSVYF